jgi:hypothetical protein
MTGLETGPLRFSDGRRRAEHAAWRGRRAAWGGFDR